MPCRLRERAAKVARPVAGLNVWLKAVVARCPSGW